MGRSALGAEIDAAVGGPGSGPQVLGEVAALHGGIICPARRGVKPCYKAASRKDQTLTASTAIIHGTGLIGASIGLGLRAAGWEVTGWDPDPAALEAAQARKALDRTAKDRFDGVENAGLVVLAGPPHATIETLGLLATDALVTDVAGVKTPVVRAGEHLARFVGGHPMAGRAQSGAALASPNLFRGAAWILTSDGASQADLDHVAGIAEGLGARPVVMSAADHDRSVAQVSHLPHVLAAALVDLVAADPQSLQLTAGSFRDLTRVAEAEPTWWAEVLIANAEEVDGAIEALERRLQRWREALRRQRSDEIREALALARRARSRLGPRVARVQIPLVDEPGELARVGRALEQSGVDVRDLQLRHAEHGGGGLLTLAVRPEDAQRLSAALVDEGFLPEVDSP